MKSIILLLALLCAGCSEPERVTEESQWLKITIDTTGSDLWEIASCSLRVSVLPPNYQDLANFATWCQKAHPEIWREYYSTIGGE